jgi:hypothetical protein
LQDDTAMVADATAALTSLLASADVEIDSSAAALLLRLQSTSSGAESVEAEAFEVSPFVDADVVPRIISGINSGSGVGFLKDSLYVIGRLVEGASDLFLDVVEPALPVLLQLLYSEDEGSSPEANCS